MGIRKVAQQSREKMGTPAFASMLIVVGIVVIVGAVYIGKSDSGQIDVTATIQNSNQAAIDAGGDPANSVKAIPEALRNLPNGGLVPIQAPEGDTPSPASVETTDTTSTSTESGEGNESGGPEEDASNDSVAE